MLRVLFGVNSDDSWWVLFCLMLMFSGLQLGGVVCGVDGMWLMFVMQVMFFLIQKLQLMFGWEWLYFFLWFLCWIMCVNKDSLSGLGL